MTDHFPRILIVEDDENDEIFLRKALRDAGYPATVETCRTGDAAIASLTDPSGNGSQERLPPDLIFLDLHLPGRSGLDVLDWLRSQHRFEKTIVVLLTGSSEAFTIDKASRLGANAYVAKPPSVDSIHVLMKALDLFEADFEGSKVG